MHKYLRAIRFRNGRRQAAGECEAAALRGGEFGRRGRGGLLGLLLLTCSFHLCQMHVVL